MAACEARLPALVDAASGDVPEADRRELAQHLATCAGCRDELAELEQTQTLLVSTSGAPDDFLLAGFAHRTADRAEAFRDRSTRGLWWSLTRAMRFTMAFSSSAVAASFALFLLARHPAVAPVSHPERMAAGTLGKAAATEAMPDEGLDESDEPADSDVVQMLSDEKAEPEEASLDTALDALSTDELNELAGKLGPYSG